jgi:hypothetical protein
MQRRLWRCSSGNYLAADFCQFGLLMVVFSAANAQELSPRAYWPAPTGTNVVVAGYQGSSGDVVTDPTLPLTGVDSRIETLQLAYQRSFSLVGRSASVLVSLPYSSGTTTGDIAGEASRRDISDWGDTRVRLAINLKGAPAVDPEGFQRLVLARKPVLGASIQLSMPTGGYETDKLINVGTNRWAVKAELGYIAPFRSTWAAEFSFGTWFFGDNRDFLGSTREQEPIVSGEFHLIKTLRSGFWASLDVNYYTGGRSTVAGLDLADLQRNSRLGATLVFPFQRTHALKVAFSGGMTTETGQDFNSLQLIYSYIWR